MNREVFQEGWLKRAFSCSFTISADMQVELLQSQPVEQEPHQAGTQIKLLQIIISSSAKLQTSRGFPNIVVCSC